MLPIIRLLLEDTLQISINWPSHMLDCSYKFSILYFISSFRYIARPQCALHVLPTEIKLYRSTCLIHLRAMSPANISHLFCSYFQRLLIQFSNRLFLQKDIGCLG